MTRSRAVPVPSVILLSLLVGCRAPLAWAEVPATGVMTVYRFNGPSELPYYAVEDLMRGRAPTPAGHVPQGSALVPCLVVHGGEPLTDPSGTPYVGFEVVMDPRTATREATSAFRTAVDARRGLRVPHHHCPPGTRFVMDVRDLHRLERPPLFDPPSRPQAAGTLPPATGPLDAIVRAFHASPQCASVNERLLGRLARLRSAWDRFAVEHAARWPAEQIARARQLDLAMRTALFEGHLDRGCSAYGGCERLVIALSIRNRARHCRRGQGCRRPGDVEGVATAVSQYNIWDEYLTQVSAITSCFLRPDLDAAPDSVVARLRPMYAQSVDAVARILFADDDTVGGLFPGVPLPTLCTLRHYYHPPAMGACFPDHPAIEFISGAVARRGDDFVLLANERVHVDAAVAGGYRFRTVRVRPDAERDLVEIEDRYPGFVLDGRKVTGVRPTGCRPHGLPSTCPSPPPAGRHRRVPPWLSAGTPLALSCRIADRGASCTGDPVMRGVVVGGACDREMQPVANVP